MGSIAYSVLLLLCSALCCILGSKYIPKNHFWCAICILASLPCSAPQSASQSATEPANATNATPYGTTEAYGTAEAHGTAATAVDPTATTTTAAATSSSASARAEVTPGAEETSYSTAVAGNGSVFASIIISASLNG